MLQVLQKASTNGSEGWSDHTPLRDECAERAGHTAGEMVVDLHRNTPLQDAERAFRTAGEMVFGLRWGPSAYNGYVCVRTRAMVRVTKHHCVGVLCNTYHLQHGRCQQRTARRRRAVDGS